MFLLTTGVYPCVLGVLCLGSGLLVDRLARLSLPASLLVAIGAAGLISLSQLTTYISALAPATPAIMAVMAGAGLLAGAPRLRELTDRARRSPWPLLSPVLVYLVALAPVLASGRPTFSSYLVLGDSAFHIVGADYLIRHGQDFSHLDLRTSYGQAIHAYYGSGYPSGADTLLGGSAFLIGAPIIWAFQPFCAFILATGAGPMWLLARRAGLQRGWATLAALAAMLPALVYGYELIGSIKEITALPMLLALGALLVTRPRLLVAGVGAAVSFGLVAAAGVSALGIGFGAWALVGAGVMLILLVLDVRAGHEPLHRTLVFTAVGVGILFIGALPTWVHVSGSLHVTEAIASTTNPGNLHTPLRSSQLLGDWLQDSYKQRPAGADLSATYALGAVTLAASILGALHLVRTCRYRLAGWLGLMLVVWLVSKLFVTTWVEAKVLVLTSPAVALLAWGGVAAAISSRVRSLAPLLALVLAGGVLASDALQYHGSNLAPTARYQELATVNSRFAGRGPALFTDYDEYSLYQLRDLDVGGPSFLYPPPAFAAADGGYRFPVELERLPPQDLLAYPLIISRRDPSANRPPSAYALLWRGTYYEVWRRRSDAPAALADAALGASIAQRCEQVRALATRGGPGTQLVAAPSPQLVRISLGASAHPRSWGHAGTGLVMSRAGRLSATFRVPVGGRWEVWLQGQFMPTVGVQIDGRPIGSIGGQLGGDSVVRNTATPLAVALTAGFHRLSILRDSADLAPGSGGSALLQGIFLSPRHELEPPLLSVPPADWRTLCGRPLEWVELDHA